MVGRSHRNALLGLVAVVVAAGIYLTASPSYAAATVISNGPVELVVVTAERRPTSLQKTSIAASVLSGDDLIKKHVVSLEQLQFTVPSMTVSSSLQGNQFNVRGLGRSGINVQLPSGVQVYRDGVASFPGFFQDEPYYDITSVEVLRGPQGTFSGLNATGGAVYINEKLPDFDSVNGYASVQGGN